MIVGPTTKGPVKLPFFRLDRRIVDLRETMPHQPVWCEFPIFIAIRAEPLAAIIVALIGKAHRDAFVATGPEFLDQTIIKLPSPIAFEEFNDFSASNRKFSPVPPLAVLRVDERNTEGSRLFQPSSASRTFAMAVSCVKGGISEGMRYAISK